MMTQAKRMLLVHESTHNIELCSLKVSLANIGEYTNLQKSTSSPNIQLIG